MKVWSLYTLTFSYSILGSFCNLRHVFAVKLSDDDGSYFSQNRRHLTSTKLELDLEPLRLISFKATDSDDSDDGTWVIDNQSSENRDFIGTTDLYDTSKHRDRHFVKANENEDFLLQIRDDDVLIMLSDEEYLNSILDKDDDNDDVGGFLNSIAETIVAFNESCADFLTTLVADIFAELLKKLIRMKHANAENSNPSFRIRTNNTSPTLKESY